MPRWRSARRRRSTSSTRRWTTFASAWPIATRTCRSTTLRSSRRRWRAASGCSRRRVTPTAPQSSSSRRRDLRSVQSHDVGSQLEHFADHVVRSLQGGVCAAQRGNLLALVLKQLQLQLVKLPEQRAFGLVHRLPPPRRRWHRRRTLVNQRRDRDVPAVQTASVSLVGGILYDVRSSETTFLQAD